MPKTVTDLARLLKVIADESRLQILGALAREELTGKELAERTDLTPATISHHMRKLQEAGVVTATPDAQRVVYHLNSDVLLESRRAPLVEATSETQPPIEGDEEARYRARVLRNFFKDGKLVSIPSQRKQRVVVLQKLTRSFTSKTRYPESQVNEILSAFHEDVATLRREMVDYGYMERERGIYWLAHRAPPRSKNVAQEITGDEHGWLLSLLHRTIEQS